MTTMPNTTTDPATLRVLAAMAQKRADRDRERQLDEQSRAARSEGYALSQLRSRA